jgi:hypothetical protein
LPEIGKMLGAWENNLLGLIQSPGGREWYHTCRYLFSPPVTNRIDSRLSQADTLPPAWPTNLPWWRLDDGEAKSAAV